MSDEAQPSPETKVVHIASGKFDQYIGRARAGHDGYFGNIYAVEPHGREMAISLYRSYFARRIKTDPIFRLRVLALRGQTLACFCKPASCHGDVIVEWLNKQPLTEENP